MKIIKVITDNNGSAKRSINEIQDAGNRLRLTHERMLAALEMTVIDVNEKLRRHLASVNVNGDKDMWSQHLLNFRKELISVTADYQLAKTIYDELFTQEK